MAFLKNRNIAVLIAVAAIVLATLFGVHRSLSSLSGDIERMFFDGVYLESEGYKQPSINSQIERMSAAALDIASLFQNHPDLNAASEAVFETRRELLNAESFSDKSRALTNMENAVVVLVSTVSRKADSSERDFEAAGQHWRTFEGASSYIEDTLAPAYNSKVDSFYSQRSLIAALISGTAPEYFRWVAASYG